MKKKQVFSRSFGSGSVMFIKYSASAEQLNFKFSYRHMNSLHVLRMKIVEKVRVDVEHQSRVSRLMMTTLNKYDTQ